jgi:hypothetical protein
LERLNKVRENPSQRKQPGPKKTKEYKYTDEQMNKVSSTFYLIKQM